MSEVANLKRSLELYKGLVEVSALINSITDFGEVLTAILEVARRVMAAEASSLFLLDDHGDLRLDIVRGPLGQVPTPPIIIPRGHGIAGWVLENRKSALVTDAYSDARFYPEVDKQSGFRTRSILCAPLTRDGSPIGVLQVLNPTSGDSFTTTELEAFEAYACLAASAIERSRTHQQQREQEWLRRELDLAHEIQTSFLPQALPELPNVKFAAAYQPARTVGGDFYDVIQLAPDEIFFVIGDVSGKGIPAALLMAQSLSMLRLIMRPGLAPADALKSWNDALTGHTIRGMFITALLGKITPAQRRVEWASAGHCPPFRISADHISDVEMRGAPPLGILPDTTYSTNTLTLGCGESLLFFTDGLTESFNAADVQLDRDGVHKILAGEKHRAPNDLVSALCRGEKQHRENLDPHDDLTLLVCGFC